MNGRFYRLFSLFLVGLLAFGGFPVSGLLSTANAATTDRSNGDWSKPYEVLYNTPEADMMVRVGDIDNFGQPFPSNYDPFSGNNIKAPYPTVQHDVTDPQGTDQLMVISAFQYPSNGQSSDSIADGYTRANNYAEGANPVVPIDLSFDVMNQQIDTAFLQMFINDYQPQKYPGKVNYSVELDGVRAPFIENVINILNQDGPIGKLITVQIPKEYIDLLKDGRLSITVDDKTTANAYGDGAAISFVKLLLNLKQMSNTGKIHVTVYDSSISNGNNKISGATVTAGGVIGWNSGNSGEYHLDDVPAGYVYVEVSKSGYRTVKQMVDLSAGQVLQLNIGLTPENNNANLSDLTVKTDQLIPLTPNFNKNTTSYTVDVKSASSFQLTPKTEDSGATLKINGQTQTNGVAKTFTNLSVGANTYSIVVTAPDGKTQKTYTVVVNRSQPATGITLDKSSLTLKVGETSLITATVLPANAANRTVNWSTSDPQIAIVDNSGKITAAKEGTATITATTADGGFSKTCAVTVSKSTWNAWLDAKVEASEKEIKKPADANASGTLNITLIPQGTALPTDARREPVDVVFVFDKSGSMTDDKINGKKKLVLAGNAVLEAIKSFRTYNSGSNNLGDRFALVAFDSDVDDSYSVLSLTNNLTSIENKVNQIILSPRGEATNYTISLDEAKEILKSTNNKRYVIFLTDGFPTNSKTITYSSDKNWMYQNWWKLYTNGGYEKYKNKYLKLGSDYIYVGKDTDWNTNYSKINQDILQHGVDKAKELSANQIKLYSIGFGNAQQLDLSYLQQLSNLTGANATEGTGTNINTVFRNITEEINRLVLGEVQLRIKIKGGNLGDNVSLAADAKAYMDGDYAVFNMSDVPFTVNGATPSQISYSLPLEFNKTGTYVFDDASLTYTQFNGTKIPAIPVMTSSNPVTITVSNLLDPGFEGSMTYDRQVTNLVKSATATSNTFNVVYTVRPVGDLNINSNGTLSNVTIVQQLPKGIELANSGDQRIRETPNEQGSLVTITLNSVAYTSAGFTPSSAQTFTLPLSVNWAMKQPLMNPTIQYQNVTADKTVNKEAAITAPTDPVTLKVILTDVARGNNYEGIENGKITKLKNADNTAIDSVYLQHDNLNINYPIKSMDFKPNTNNQVIQVTHRDVEGNTDLTEEFSLVPLLSMKKKNSQTIVTEGAKSNEPVQVSLAKQIPSSGEVTYSYRITKDGTAGAWTPLLSPYLIELATNGVYKVEVYGQGGFSDKEVAATNVTVFLKNPPAVPQVNPVDDDDTSVTGTAEPGTIITVTKADGTVLGTGTTRADGTYTVSIPVQSAGTVLKVTATDDFGNVSPPTEVTVISSVIHVQSITLDQTNITMVVGTDMKLTATILPKDATNQKVTWSSDNTNIASVDQNGNVTANKSGSTTITVKTEDGGFTAECKVKVIDKTLFEVFYDANGTDRVQNDDTWLDRPVYVKLTYADETDRTYKVTHRETGVVEEHTYSGLFLVDQDGINEIEYYEGPNDTHMKQRLLKLDLSDLSVTITGGAIDTQNHVVKDISISATDTGNGRGNGNANGSGNGSSGVDYILVWTDNNPAVRYDQSAVTFTTPPATNASITVYAQAYNKAGVASPVASQTYVFDTSPPTVSIGPGFIVQPDGGRGAITIKASVTDDVSGVLEVTYRIEKATASGSTLVWSGTPYSGSLHQNSDGYWYATEDVGTTPGYYKVIITATDTVQNKTSQVDEQWDVFMVSPGYQLVGLTYTVLGTNQTVNAGQPILSAKPIKVSFAKDSTTNSAFKTSIADQVAIVRSLNDAQRQALLHSLFNFDLRVSKIEYSIVKQGAAPSVWKPLQTSDLVIQNEGSWQIYFRVTDNYTNWGATPVTSSPQLSQPVQIKTNMKKL